ncbi:MAG: hypothetical protein ACI9KE_000025 [Polyangiales bacterium]|jgi:hypothetical protein
MTTQHSNTSDSGLIELSKIRESLDDANKKTELDPSLLSEHVPVLRVDKPRRSRVSVLGVATAASVLLGLTSAAYALHHEVTQHKWSTPVATVQVAKTSTEPATAALVTPEQTEVLALEETREALAPAAPTPALVSATRPRTRRTARQTPSRPTSPRSSDDSIDALLHAATGGQVTLREGSTRAAESSLPLRPARAHVSSSFRGVTRAIQACGNGAEGVVSARATVVGSTGRVRSVSLSGVSGETERCMERALMGVQLEPFQQDRLEITFPYRM